jgi:hypothetical protein
MPGMPVKAFRLKAGGKNVAKKEKLDCRIKFDNDKEEKAVMFLPLSFRASEARHGIQKLYILFSRALKDKES